MNKILVIEDDLLIRLSMLDLLESENYEVFSAKNGLEGLELTNIFHPNLIICDIGMPDMDGYEVLKALREEPLTATIPFIFSSARAEKASIQRAMAAGANAFLTKPFTRVELLTMLTACLHNSPL